MKARIEVLLSIWGRWAIKRESGALGFGSVSPMFREAKSGGGYGSATPMGFVDDDVAMVDACVMALPLIQRLAVIEVYQRQGSMREAAARCGVSHHTLARYINEAHEKISLDMENRSAQNPGHSSNVHQCASVKGKPATA